MSRSSTLHIKPTFRNVFYFLYLLANNFYSFGVFGTLRLLYLPANNLKPLLQYLTPSPQFYADSENLQSPATTPFSLRTQKSRNLFKIAVKKEAWVGIEPTVKLLQSHALPLGYHALKRSFIRKKRKTYCKLFFACAALLLKLSQIKKFLLRRLNPARPACANENRSTPARGKLQSGPALRRL